MFLLVFFADGLLLLLLLLLYVYGRFMLCHCGEDYDGDGDEGRALLGLQSEEGEE